MTPIHFRESQMGQGIGYFYENAVLPRAAIKPGHLAHLLSVGMIEPVELPATEPEPVDPTPAGSQVEPTRAG
jgi:hypothetical protein